MVKKKVLLKKRKKRSYTAKHSQSMIDLAIDALKKKTMSSYDAEKIFGIPRRTLLDKLHSKHPKNLGCPTKLTDEEEANTIKVLIAAAEYGSPLTLLDLRIVVYRYLEANGRLLIFDNKLPGKKWAYSFIKRNKSKLSYRVLQNIKRSRAEKTPDEIREYFTNLNLSLEGVPSENILNYDETNLTDNPGAQKCLFKRGVKYPERVLNYTKGSISIMFAITAGGECLPPYVVYKAEHLYTQWSLNGPKGSRFNRSKSGWFDSNLFEDWFESIIIPWAKTKTGTKVLIGDNLASHINHKIVTYCQQNDIRFVFLPPNSSHITQPLDVCYFGPLKKLWREILLNYKMKNPREPTIHKGHFPDLLKKLVEKLNEKTHNIISAFKSTGIVPFNPDQVIKKLPGSTQSTTTYTIDQALLDWLKETRTADPTKKVRNKKLHVPPGKSVCTSDFEDLQILPEIVKKGKRQRKKKSNTVKLNSDFIPQPLTILKNPCSLKKLCLKSFNSRLIQSEQFKHSDKKSSSQASNVHNLCDISMNDKTNMPFINDLPECLQLNKAKIRITSDVTIKPELSQKTKQSKQGNINIINKYGKITRSALHMKLIPLQKEILTHKRKALEENMQHQQTKEFEKNIDVVNKKPKKENLKKTAKKEENKAKLTPKKQKSVKQKKRFSSDSSLTSDIEISIADTDDSEYETMDDIITSQQEEQENIDPSIPYGISDIEYFTEDDKKIKTDSWILAKFTTKKSVKHFVGKVISMKGDVPEVKFVRKKKETKFDRGFVFSYPTVDDICIIQNFDDIILILPEPNISRRGQIIFNIDLSNYNIQ